ncbi:large-conductance mechanosensitive channel protein MscL [Algoriphagus vanfongensis]|uniref:large-conductance mechanosensitive channel protein MscL n=1 Tax=Algoriphagus vanfongensis TaxID=426371 RepID=UPI0004162EC7|nr:large-conductance mechanosensitive channel protein MscL [Algoriphagus vanfongensis]
MGMLKEFKEFAMKGNVVDMAVGVIIGGAFGKIVTSLVNDVIMPPIGLALGGMNFRNLAVVLKEAELDAAGEIITNAVTINYGMFIQNLVDFIIIAFVIFMTIKGINKMKRKEEKKEAAAPPPAPPKSEVLLEEIRDLLKKQ